MQHALATAADTHVYIGQVLNWILSLIGSIVLSMVGAFAFVLLAKLNQKWKLGLTQQDLDIAQKQWDTIHSTASSAAGRWWAAHEGDNVAKLSVNVGSPGIAALAQAAVDQIPDQVHRLGGDDAEIEDQMTKLIVAKIGQMQQSVPPASAPVIVTDQSPVKP